MSSEPAQTTRSTETAAALGELACALRRVAEGSSLEDVLRSIADATLVAAAADVVIVRILDDEGASLEARAVSASSTSVAAELQGSRTAPGAGDRKSTRLNSSHTVISYAVFCLKKKKSTNCCTPSHRLDAN